MYIDPRLKELNRERKFARKLFKPLETMFSSLNLLKLISKLSEKIETDELINLNADDGTIWKHVKPFKKKYKNIPNLIGPAGIANTDQDKANFLANSLETHFTLNSISDPETIMKSVNSLTPHPSEILLCIKKLETNKAPGIDCIKNKMLKNLPCNIILNLNTIIEKI
ncbi:hypothetical protein AVEN_74933-1 [Araneus ventricosus]|uniref:RNA-directed DNA polymerase from transposon BS n=1 Tax=Araneus ventricosus TaxID=182803 RepID=A0A4Y2M587_ARAVE|nr:hypothetical protein AVEN_74933-1 [Araneus ventricosus]